MPSSTQSREPTLPKLGMLTPPEVAKRLRVSSDKIRAWIESGELEAINVAARAGGRPRWRIAEVDLAKFEAQRTAQPKPKVRRRRPRQSAGVTKFF